MFLEKPLKLETGWKQQQWAGMKKNLRVRTWNMLSLYRSGSLQNLIEVTHDYYKIDLLSVQEVRWLGRIVLERRIAKYTIVVMINSIFLEQALLLVNTSDQE
jgi:hypothetical protein